MESWQAALVAVVSLVGGAALLVLVRAAIAVRGARAALERAASSAERALGALAATAERVERATAGLDERRVGAFMEAVDALAETVSRLRETARVATAVGAAVGPAVGAAVRAWRAGHTEEGGSRPRAEDGAGLDGKGEAR